MNKADYKEAIRLSRAFNNRSVEDTKKLYSTIQKAVHLAQKKEGVESENALSFLIEVYEPYIKKISGKYFTYVSNPLEYEDVLQEVYVIFLVLTYKYDKLISSFSYYINLMLPQYMNVWLQKITQTYSIPVDIKIIESTVSHPSLDTADKVYDYLNGTILEREYIHFIEERAKKNSRSNTVKEVCDKIFLGNTTCSELAQELGISYHAVYEIINKIKKELRFFFNSNRFSEYYITSTGEYMQTGDYEKINFSYHYGTK
jgi:RNA polymerase sigma factor (sigma-70 family)